VKFVKIRTKGTCEQPMLPNPEYPSRAQLSSTIRRMSIVLRVPRYL